MINKISIGPLQTEDAKQRAIRSLEQKLNEVIAAVNTLREELVNAGVLPS